MKKLEFEDISVGMTIRRKGTKDGLLTVTKKNSQEISVKFIETKYQPAHGINEKEYKITLDQFYQLGYVGL